MAEPGPEIGLLVPGPTSSHYTSLLRQLPEVGLNSPNNCLTPQLFVGVVEPLEMYLEVQDYACLLKSQGGDSTFHFPEHRVSQRARAGHQQASFISIAWGQGPGWESETKSDPSTDAAWPAYFPINMVWTQACVCTTHTHTPLLSSLSL